MSLVSQWFCGWLIDVASLDWSVWTPPFPLTFPILLLFIIPLFLLPFTCVRETERCPNFKHPKQNLFVCYRLPLTCVNAEVWQKTRPYFFRAACHMKRGHLITSYLGFFCDNLNKLAWNQSLIGSSVRPFCSTNQEAWWVFFGFNHSCLGLQDNADWKPQRKSENSISSMLSMGHIFHHEVSLSLKELAVTKVLQYISSRMPHAEMIGCIYA